MLFKFLSVFVSVRYPVTERSELVLWILWSRDKKGNPQGVWSRQTALDIHEISDIMPSKSICSAFAATFNALVYSYF